MFDTDATDAEPINEPLTIPISVNLVSADAVNEFNAVVEVLEEVYEFNAATDMSTLDDLDSKFVNLPSCVSFVVFAVDAEVINEPLTTPISVNCVNTDELNEFILVIEVLTLAEVDSKFVNLPKFEPLTVFKASMLVC